MGDSIVLSVRESNLLRKRLQDLLHLRQQLVSRPDQETVHDLRVASRRAREVIDYLQSALPESSYAKLRAPARRITRSLGDLRETEVNLALTEKLHNEGLIEPLAAELLIHTLNNRKRKLQRKVSSQMKAGKFAPYRKFLTRLKGARLAIPASQDVLQRRAQDFYSFSLSDDLKDEELHELRILTKKFRYALEIHNRLRNLKLGRFIFQLKKLQEALGEIHDLYVFAILIKEQAQKWNEPALTLIPEALHKAIIVVTSRKEKAYPRTVALYKKVLESSPEDILPIPRKFVQSADSSAIEIDEIPAGSAVRIS